MTISKKITSLACSLPLLWVAHGFSPSSLTTKTDAGHRTFVSSSALHVSVVSKFLKTTTQDDEARESQTQRLSKAFETETPDSVGVTEVTSYPQQHEKNNLAGAGGGGAAAASIKKRRRRNRRKHNFSDKKKFLREKPDTDFYTLHSSAISHLHKNMPINDILRAIKRAQNLHDVHDLATIAAFLIDECDESWGYGFRGSLLSRLAVAALHMNEIDVANRAIQTRRIYERPSMQPYESAAIVRGLMRAGKVENAWTVLEDELRLPLEGTDLTSQENQQKLKQRALTLTSIASRHLYQGEPHLAARALQSLRTLGGVIEESQIEFEELNMPWTRLINAAAAANCQESDALNTCEHFDSSLEVPSDMTSLVFAAMSEFPCPGGEKECNLDDFIDA